MFDPLTVLNLSLLAAFAVGLILMRSRRTVKARATGVRQDLPRS